MARYIVNEWSWVGFIPGEDNMFGIGVNPTAEMIEEAIVLTPWIASITAATQGNTVPTTSIDTLFETSIAGTAQASFTADFFRDDESTPGDADTAWETLPRAQKGTFIIARFGVKKGELPELGAPVELWPVVVTSRAMGAMASNTAQTFTVTCAVPKEPNEAAIVTP